MLKESQPHLTTTLALSFCWITIGRIVELKKYFCNHFIFDYKFFEGFSTV
jgi:hypothetical protein